MTDFDLQQQLAAQRRQQYAQQSQFNAPQGQMIGRHYVAPNALQYLASGLRSLGGMRGQQLAEEELGQIQQGKNQAIASALRGFSDMAQGRPADVLPPDQAGPVRPAQAPDMAGAYQSLLSAPTTELRQMGMQGLTQQAQANAKSAQEAQWRQILASAPDAQAAQRAGVPADYVKSYYELRNAGRDKVARTVEVSGPKGEKLVQQIDEFGSPVGQPMPAYLAPVQVNRGDKIELVTPTAGQAFTVGMSPAQRDAAARGWATVRQGEQRLAQDSGTKAPAGYRFKADGSLEAIPGGPADAKGGQKLTESQAKGSLYLGQMRSASAELDKLPSASPMAVAATGKTYTNWLTSANAQKVAQLQNQWAEAFLRAKTGAAATQGEVELNVRTFFPVVGDWPQAIEQKRRMRQQAEQDMGMVAGPGASSAGGLPLQDSIPTMPQGFRVVQ